MITAGSLRIETFEGSRPRLRRTREGYGRSIDRGAPGLNESVAFDDLRGAVDISGTRTVGKGIGLRAELWSALGSRRMQDTPQVCLPQQANGRR